MATFDAIADVDVPNAPNSAACKEGDVTCVAELLMSSIRNVVQIAKNLYAKIIANEASYLLNLLNCNNDPVILCCTF